MNVRNSVSKIFLSNIGASIAVFAGVTLFARELGPTELGTYFLFQAVLGISTVPVDLGLKGAVAKRLSEGDHPGATLGTAIALKAVPLGVVAGLVVLFGDQVASYLGGPFVPLLILGMVLQQASGVTIKVLYGELRVGETAAIKFADKLTWLLVGAVLVFGFDYGGVGLIYGLLAGYAVVLAWAGYKVSTPIGRPSRERARSLLAYAPYNAISATSFTLFGWLDVAIIGFFLAQSAVGSYEVAWRVAGVVTLLAKAISTTIFPQMSAMDAAGETEEIEGLLASVVTPALAVVIPAIFGVALYGEEILTIVFGPEYGGAWLVLVVLMSQKLFVAVRRLGNRALQGIDRPDLTARSNVVGIGLNLGLNLLFVPTLGLIGAAVATTLATAIDTALHVYYLSDHLTIRVPYQELGWCLLASLGMTAVLLGLRGVVVVDDLVTLLASVGFGAAVYGALVLVFPPLRQRVLRNARAAVGS